jgi:hypothetical protein
MNVRKILVGFVLSLMMSSATAIGTAAPASGQGEAPPMFQLLGMSGICADQQYLYVMTDGKIMQYEITDMNLVETVTLPEPPSPPRTPPSRTDSSQLSPPPPPPIAGPHGLWLGNDVLYVLAGPVIYRYSTPDLTLQTTVELPKPEFPRVGN